MCEIVLYYWSLVCIPVYPNPYGSIWSTLHEQGRVYIPVYPDPYGSIWSTLHEQGRVYIPVYPDPYGSIWSTLHEQGRVYILCILILMVVFGALYMNKVGFTSCVSY